MENPWFGRKADGYVGGIASWRGLLVTIVGLGGAFAAHAFLSKPWGDWIGGALLVAFGIAFWCKYDPDTDT